MSGPQGAPRQSGRVHCAQGVCAPPLLTARASTRTRPSSRRLRLGDARASEPPTPLEEVDAIVKRVAGKSAQWARVPCEERARMLRDMLPLIINELDAGGGAALSAEHKVGGGRSWGESTRGLSALQPIWALNPASARGGLFRRADQARQFRPVCSGGRR